MKEFNKEQERSKKYGCDGICYTPYNTCPKIETCPETKTREFAGTIVAVATMLFVIIAAIVEIILIARGIL